MQVGVNQLQRETATTFLEAFYECVEDMDEGDRVAWICHTLTATPMLHADDFYKLLKTDFETEAMECLGGALFRLQACGRDVKGMMEELLLHLATYAALLRRV